eukprot:c27570_g1_i2 orf=333-2045(+)
MDRDGAVSPFLPRHRGAGSVPSSAMSPVHPSAALSPIHPSLGMSPIHPSAHHVRSASTGQSSVRRSQNSAARAAAQRLAQAMASQANEEEEDESPFSFESRYRPARVPSAPLVRNSMEDSPISLRSSSAAVHSTVARPVSAVPAPGTSSRSRGPVSVLPARFTETSKETNVPRIGGRFSDTAQDDRREAASLHDKIDLLQEEKEDLREQLCSVEEKYKESEARAKELEKQVASLGEGISLEARLISRKEAVLRQREAAIKAAEQSKDVKDDEIAALRLDVEAARDEATAAVEKAKTAEAETLSLRIMTQRMILTQEEMEEVVLKRCWLARYWSLAVRYGIHSEIAGSKHEHWSSFAPLPLEVVLSAGQKAKEEPEKDEQLGENGAKGNRPERRLKFIRDLNDISGEGNIESMLAVEKGLRELGSLKVEDAVMVAMAQQRRPISVRVGQAFAGRPEPAALKNFDSPRLMESIELTSEEVEDVQFKQAWLVYFWRQARNNGVEEDVADERLQYWINRNNQNPTPQDAVDVERGLLELRKLGIENQLWEASRREIQELATLKPVVAADGDAQA